MGYKGIGLLFIVFLCATTRGNEFETQLCGLVLAHFAAVSDLKDIDLHVLADLHDDYGKPEIAEIMRIHSQLQKLKREQKGPNLPSAVAPLLARREEILRGRSLLDLAVVIPPQALRTPLFGAKANTNHFHRVRDPLAAGSFNTRFEISDLITQGQWALVFERNPAHHKFLGSFRIGDQLVDPLLPIENITVYSAMEFANRLSELEGRTPVYQFDPEGTLGSAEDGTLRLAPGRAVRLRPNSDGYHLPNYDQMLTVKELEGDGADYDRTTLGSFANYDRHAWSPRNAQLVHLPSELGAQRTKAKKAAPGSKLYDLFGNVSEWVTQAGGRVIANDGDFQFTRNDSNFENEGHSSLYLLPDDGGARYDTGFRLVRRIPRK